jgi:outer membrane PBP1 activator LpoA protein
VIGTDKRHPARRAGQQASVGTTLIRRLQYLTIAAAIAVFAGGCAAPGGSFGGAAAERRAESLAQSGQYSDAAGAYIGLAASASGTERDRLTLLAVEQWLFAGDGRRARSALSQVATPESGELLWLWSADAAALSLWEGRPDRALSLLEPLSRQALPASHRARVEALRGDAWFQKGEPLRAVDLYMQRENWLTDPRDIEASRNRLWAGLQVVDVETLREAASISYDPIARGWLSLAVLANSTGQQGIGWGNGIVRWQETYAGHPAASVLSELTLPEDSLLNYPRQIALLLPLSGGNESAGNAIKNGFLGSYFSAVGGVDNQQQVRIYDVNEDGASAAYQQAVLDGAEFVVGPLLRRNVTELASELLLPVPVLSLNYLPNDVPAPPGFFQFALAPEDEAAAAAERAIVDQGLRGVALVPANDWGRRVLASFATELEGLGGTLLDVQNYEPGAQDFSFEIENLVGLSQSVQRYQRLRANIGGPLQFDPRRRQDIDFVFLGADARAGRLIKSQLKFHYSGDLPVYSTSFIYSMDGRSDSDLNEVRFADAPWVISPPAWIADYPAMYGQFWPAERRLSRLHAMGYDAYHLVGALFNARETGIEETTGATGQLFMTSDGRIHRKLAWAEFEQGRPVPLPDANAFQEGLDDPEATDETDFKWPEPSPDD